MAADADISAVIMINMLIFHKLCFITFPRLGPRTL